MSDIYAGDGGGRDGSRTLCKTEILMRLIRALLFSLGLLASNAWAEVAVQWTTCQSEQRGGVPINRRELYAFSGSAERVDGLLARATGNPPCNQYMGVALRCAASHSPGWYATLISQRPRRFVHPQGYNQTTMEAGTAFALCGASTYEEAVTTMLSLCAADGMCSSQQQFVMSVGLDTAGLAPDLPPSSCTAPGAQSFSEASADCEGAAQGRFTKRWLEDQVRSLKELAAKVFSQRPPPAALQYVTIGAGAPQPAVLGPTSKPNAVRSAAPQGPNATGSGAPSATGGTKADSAKPTQGKAVYFVQVSTHPQRQRAEAVRRDIRKYLDTQATVQEHAQGGRQLYRVRIGPFSDESEARKTLERIKTEGLTDQDPVLVRIGS